MSIFSKHASRFLQRTQGKAISTMTDDASVVTPLVLTFNEAPNIRRSLARLTWARRVVVVDSHSTDRTIEIAREFPNVAIFVRAFDNHTNQWNFGLQQVDSEWTLALDADYLVPIATSLEIVRKAGESRADGYYARLTYCIRGRPLRHALLPPRLVLFRTRAGHFYQDGHTQLLRLEGRQHTLDGDILHDDRKSLRRWLAAQDRYADLEVQKLLNGSPRELLTRDRIRKAIVIAPWLVPAYYLVAKGGVRDGWVGVDYAAQRAIAELVLSIKLIQQMRSQGAIETEIE